MTQQLVVGSNYAYLVDAEVTGIIDNRLELKLFTDKGETQVVKAANRVKVNNTSNLNGKMPGCYSGRKQRRNSTAYHL